MTFCVGPSRMLLEYQTGVRQDHEIVIVIFGSILHSYFVYRAGPLH
jgi:hypothetical protein